MTQERVNFGSKLGMVLATAGSAVGLGNVWRFPYMVGENGGAAFILIYIMCIMLLGIPCMMSEFIIGRHGAANTARAYSRMDTHKAWHIVGLMGVITVSSSRLLCRSVGLVLAVHLCLGRRRASWRPAIHSLLLCRLLRIALEARVLDSSSVPAHPCHHSAWRAWRYREGFESTYAHTLPAIAGSSGLLVSASGGAAGIEFLFKPDFSKVTAASFLLPWVRRSIR